VILHFMQSQQAITLGPPVFLRGIADRPIPPQEKVHVSCEYLVKVNTAAVIPL
jgi:hypothetical protein